MIAQMVEAMIPFVSGLKESLEKVKDAYQKLPHLIDREHRAIRSGVFSEVQGTCEEKEALTQFIEKEVQSLSQTIRELNRLTGSHYSSVGDSLKGLHALVEKSEIKDTLAHQVLQHVTNAAIRSSEELNQTVEKVRPMIESNRDLVTSLMDSYSKSYQFWQEIQEQVATSYNSGGVQKAIGRVSGFRARA